jgi:hypothetical protein
MSTSRSVWSAIVDKLYVLLRGQWFATLGDVLLRRRCRCQSCQKQIASANWFALLRHTEQFIH